MDKAYDVDTYGWAMEQADALKRRAANEIDWDNVAEEIESLGKQQAAELYNRYVVLVTHLLKWIYQPSLRSRSWRATIQEQRRAIARHTGENPSLKPVLEKEFNVACEVARERASGETDLDVGTFPVLAPFTREEAENLDWWPMDEGEGA